MVKLVWGIGANGERSRAPSPLLHSWAALTFEGHKAVGASLAAGPAASCYRRGNEAQRSSLPCPSSPSLGLLWGSSHVAPSTLLVPLPRIWALQLCLASRGQPGV